ncbi:hypothetical protein ACFL2T_07530, partial [Elusimicrobiota bacterium]
IAGALTWAAVSWLGIGGAAFLVIGSGIWGILVQRWSDMGSQDSAWSVWTMVVTGIMFTLLVGPIGQAVAPNEPLWVDLMMGGAPAGMAAMMTRRWINNNIGPVPDTFKRLGLWFVSRKTMSAMGKDLLTIAAAVGVTLGATTLIGLGGAFLIQLTVGIWSILVQRWSNLGEWDSVWSGWTLAITAILGALLVGPIGQGMAAWGPVPLWLNLILGGIPAALGGMMTRRWIIEKVGFMPRALRKRILGLGKYTKLSGGLKTKDLRPFTRRESARLRAMTRPDSFDPADWALTSEYLPLVSLLAEWDPSVKVRGFAYDIMLKWAASPSMRDRVRKVLRGFKSSKSPHVSQSSVDWNLGQVDAYDKQEKEVVEDNAPDLGAVVAPKEDAEIGDLLKEAGAYLKRKDLTRAPQVLRRKAIRRAVDVLEKALAGKDEDAKAIAAERLKRLLRGVPTAMILQ